MPIDMLFFQLLIFSALLSSMPNTGVSEAEKYFKSYGVEGCFMLYDPEDQKTFVYNPERCEIGYMPKSTFKVPHALIALEEEVLQDENQILAWDGTKHTFQSWNRDQNLQSAMKYSCVWFFSRLTESIDSITYSTYLDQFDYGNRDITGPHSHFWLYGKLRISASQQIEFMNRFYYNNLKIKRKNTEIVKKLILLEEEEGYRFYGKTGGGPLAEGGRIMWLTGFVEKEEDVYFYAMNFTCEEFTEETAKARFVITKNIFRDLKLIP